MKRVVSLGFGKLAILATLASVLFILVAFGQQMFSAGPLSEQNRRDISRGGVRSHAEIASCSACHAGPLSGETMATRCLDCHDNIRSQLDSQQPMHGLLLQGEDCMSCHTEHKGPHGALTSFARFDHDCAAFKLTGKHKQVDCKSCHANSVYQGTAHTCFSCHAEPAVHRGKFGTDCLTCHSPDTWKTTTFTASGAGLGQFNHDVTGFKLRDKHAAIDCKSCHVAATFKGLSPSCVSCHKEPMVHQGKFGLDCLQCHVTQNWRSVALTKEHFALVNFDHDMTAFKLTGKHQAVDCKSCHVGNTFKGTPQTCVSCHAEPPSHKPHPTSFGANCVQCHSPLSWQGAKLTKHTFPVNHGARRKANAANACKVCHPATIQMVSLPVAGAVKTSPSYASYTCYGCHEHTLEKETRRHARNRKVTDLNKCATCHKTGRERDRRTALEFDADAEFCQACPAATGGLDALRDFLTLPLVPKPTGTQRQLAPVTRTAPFCRRGDLVGALAFGFATRPDSMTELARSFDNVRWGIQRKERP